MKKALIHLFLLFFLVVSSQEIEQKSSTHSNIQLSYFHGNILPQKGVKQLITGYPSGFFASWNRHTFGDQLWEQYYNYPDVGVSFMYQDFKNTSLGKLYALYGHYNFYLLKHELKNKLIFSLGTGLAYITNPYDKVTNNKNVSIGTHFNSTSFIKLLYQRERVFQNIGFQAGFSFIHASNASLKAPNKGINTWGMNIGLNYEFNSKPIAYNKKRDTTNYQGTYHFNIALLIGANESDFINTGIKPFAVLTFFADKRLNRKNGLQFGAELDFHYYLKDFIKFKYIFNGDVTRTSYPDWKRVGVFIGHELFFNKFSLTTQIGTYVYSPDILNENIYERVIFKRYFKNSYFASISVKMHLVNAESLEFGIGYQF